jgi:hypothetical protein
MRFVKRFFIYLFIDIKKSLDYLMVKPKYRSLINYILGYFRYWNCLKMANRPNYIFGIKSIEILFTSDYTSICTISEVRTWLVKYIFFFLNRNYQIVFCYSIIETNNRYSLPETYSTNEYQNGNVSSNILYSYFPFDPYVLKRSLTFIQPIYNDYRDENDDTNMPKDSDDNDVGFFLSQTLNSKLFLFSIKISMIVMML